LDGIMRSVHIYPSTFEFETRILKVTRTLIERTAVDRIIVVALAGPGLPEKQAIDASREVWRIGYAIAGEQLWAKVLRFLEWSVRVVWRLRREKIDIVNCHSLSVLPLCVLLQVLHKAILVYEPHELETETITSTGLRRRLAKVLEAALIRRADKVIVVSDSIARHYCADYRLGDVLVVRNAPEGISDSAPRPSRIFRDLYAIPEDHLVFLYIGVLDEARGTRILLDCFKRLSSDRHLIFLGFGTMEEEIRAASRSHPNIHLHSAVPQSRLAEYTVGADIGFSIMDGSCLNHRCALPNKLFQYLQAGLPVIVSDLEEMGEFVRQWRCGWCIGNDPAEIAALVSRLTSEDVARAKEGAERSRRTIDWAFEADKLAQTYADLFARLGQAAAMQDDRQRAPGSAAS
jgi:glycosyltransferase involved in cell wall biosynthesis